MTTWDTNFENALLAAKDYREFLGQFFKKNPGWKSPRPLSYSRFAQKAGFASKSLISEVVSGRKPLNPSSFEKVLVGLNMGTTWNDYLHCLIAIEEDSFQSKIKNTAYFRRRLATKKKQLTNAQKLTWLQVDSERSWMTAQAYATDVIVAAGNPATGASFQEIQNKAKVEPEFLKEILLRLQSRGLMRKDPASERYHNILPATNSQHSYSDSSYQSYFAASLEKAKARMRKSSNEDSLYSTQTFTVKKSSLKRLRDELNRIVREFADEADDDNGDGIAEICVTLTHNFES